MHIFEKQWIPTDAQSQNTLTHTSQTAMYTKTLCSWMLPSTSTKIYTRLQASKHGKAFPTCSHIPRGPDFVWHAVHYVTHDENMTCYDEGTGWKATVGL